MITHHYIAHRINQAEDLKKLPKQYGVEIDIRPFAENLVLQHDPYITGESLENYLSQYQHGTLILNVKAEAIEFKILELLKKHQIKNYFFLDCSFPMINRLAAQGETQVALRFSEFEGMDTLKAMAKRVQWVWVDCFTRLPLDHRQYQEIKNLGYKLCLVSPELQGQAEKIPEYKKILQDQKIVFDAICTKAHNIPLWEKA